jgi:hypothetical protein
LKAEIFLFQQPGAKIGQPFQRFGCKKSQLADYSLRLAGTGERVLISNNYNRHNARYRCSPVPNIFYFLQANLQKLAGRIYNR